MGKRNLITSVFEKKQADVKSNFVKKIEKAVEEDNALEILNIIKNRCPVIKKALEDKCTDKE